MKFIKKVFFRLFALLLFWQFSIQTLQAQTYLLNGSTNGTTITTCAGNFYDSGGAGGKYKTLENYTVTFCATSPDDKIVLNFSSFNLKDQYAKMYIYDGANTSGTLLGTYTGGGSPGSIASIGGNCLTIKFTSDNSEVKDGWAATISCTTPVAGAAGDYSLSDTNNGTTNTVCTGNFYDSGGSAGNYTNSQDRTITFCASTPTDKLRLTFSAFNIESGYDFMSIYDGANTSGSLIGTYSANSSPGTVTSSSGNCLTIRFKSDNTVAAAGWAAAISCVAPSSTNACGLVIKNVNISGCYINAGVSKATVSVEIVWTTAPANQTINVTLGGLTRTIKPGTTSVSYGTGAIGNGNQVIVSPQVVAFELNADGSSGTINAVFSGTPACNSNNAYSLPASCVSTCNGTMLGGIVFNDYNRDGIKTANETSTVGNITVKAFGVDGSIYTTKTDAAGQYSLTVPPTNYPVRLEFSDIPTAYGQGTRNGTNGRTTTQFIAAPTCIADLGILTATDYCVGNTRLYTPCYVDGNPLVAGAPSTANAFVGFNYGATGTATAANETSYATAGQVGSLWGLAYNKFTKRIFTTAILKRHVGLGPKGLGGLYVIDPSIATGPVASWDLTTLGINFGTVGDNVSRNLNNTLPDPSADTTGWYGAGRRGIGDIDISEDGNFLYFVNLFDKKLYKLDITAYNTSNTAPTSADWIAYSIPNPGCSGGSLRPWGNKAYNGKIYVGAICDAFTSQNKSDMRAYILEFDPATGSWLNRLDFPLTYPKGFAVGTSAALLNVTGWYPWLDNFASKVTSGWLVHPEPILSDIEFDIDGSMTIGFMDRTALQGGYQNVDLTGNTGTLYSATAGGDLIKAYYNNGSFIIENNAKAGPSSGAGVGNNQGPGGGEFYNDNWLFSNGSLYHAENSLGGLAVLPGSGEVVSANIDPTDGTAWSAGIRYYNNSTGLLSKSFVVYESDIASGVGTQGKALGLGDLELACALATDIEIGNRVWVDTNKDGVQDPNEPPLVGVKVRLYKGNTLIAETTTNANGEYYFIDNSVAGVTWSGTGADIALLPNTAYAVVFGKSTTDQYNASGLTVGGTQYTLTTVNSTLGTGNDLNDSDATVTAIAGGNYPTIGLTTGVAGAINHTYDVGFYQCVTITLPSANQAVCTNGSGSNITVQTGGNATNSIAFVVFTSDQMAGTTPTDVEAAAIYAGTIISLVTPTGAGNPYTATYIWNSADFPNGTNAIIDYYVYTILNPDGGASCRPAQEIKISVSPAVTAGTGTNPAPICQGGSGLANVDLFTQLAGEMTGGAWSQTAGASVGTALDTATGILNPNGIANGTYTFRYTVMGIAPCPNDTEDVMVTIQTCCPPKICLPITVTRN
jgi:hypothetical protein